MSNFNEFKAHLQKYYFEWLKDGTNKSGIFKFFDDGTFRSSYGNGLWYIIDVKTLAFNYINDKSLIYIVKFNHDCTQGILT